MINFLRKQLKKLHYYNNEKFKKFLKIHVAQNAIIKIL